MVSLANFKSGMPYQAMWKILINGLCLDSFPSDHRMVRDDVDLVTIKEDASKVIYLDRF